MIIPMSPGLKAEGTVSFEKPGLSSIIVLCFCVASKVCCRLIETKTIFMYHIPPTRTCVVTLTFQSMVSPAHLSGSQEHKGKCQTF